MSYSIIFETKIVNLKDGRILHLDRSGCNNDNAGRSRDEFTGKVYTKEEFIKYAEHFINDDMNGYGLKIGSKWSTYADYGKHLLRMLKRAKTWDEYSKERAMRATEFKGVHLLKPFEGDVSADEFDKKYYDWMYSETGISYYRRTEDYYSEDEIISLIENGSLNRTSFYVGKAS